MNKYLFYISSFLFLVCWHANSHELKNNSSQEAQIMLPINSLIDGIREGDAQKVRSAFAPQALIHRAHETLREDTTVDSFAQVVASKGDAVWDEKIWDIQINTEDKLAAVWTQFVFVLNGNLSHCGINSFQLYKFDDGWKIIYLADTVQKEGCEIPPEAQ